MTEYRHLGILARAARHQKRTAEFPPPPPVMLIAPKRRSQQSNPIDRRRVQGRLPGGGIGDHGLDRAVALLRQQEFGVAHLEGVVLDQDVLVFDRTVAALISHLPAKSL